MNTPRIDRVGKCICIKQHQGACKSAKIEMVKMTIKGKQLSYKGKISYYDAAQIIAYIGGRIEKEKKQKS